MTIINAIVGVQAITYLALFPLFVLNGNWRLGVAQFLLAIITGLIYWI